MAHLWRCGLSLPFACDRRHARHRPTTRSIWGRLPRRPCHEAICQGKTRRARGHMENISSSPAWRNHKRVILSIPMCTCRRSACSRLCVKIVGYVPRWTPPKPASRGRVKTGQWRAAPSTSVLARSILIEQVPSVSAPAGRQKAVGFTHGSWGTSSWPRSCRSGTWRGRSHWLRPSCRRPSCPSRSTPRRRERQPRNAWHYRTWRPERRRRSARRPRARARVLRSAYRTRQAPFPAMFQRKDQRKSLPSWWGCLRSPCSRWCAWQESNLRPSD